MLQAEQRDYVASRWREKEVGDFGRRAEGLGADNWRGRRFVEGSSDPMGCFPGDGWMRLVDGSE